MVERRIPNPMVAGSSPPSPATFYMSEALELYPYLMYLGKLMNLNTHIKNARLELSKVIFPTKGQVKQAYIAVVIVVAVIAAFLALVDLLMSSVMTAVLG